MTCYTHSVSSRLTLGNRVLSFISCVMNVLVKCVYKSYFSVSDFFFFFFLFMNGKKILSLFPKVVISCWCSVLFCSILIFPRLLFFFVASWTMKLPTRCFSIPFCFFRVECSAGSGICCCGVWLQNVVVEKKKKKRNFLCCLFLPPFSRYGDP